jgi:hypothetical protein
MKKKSGGVREIIKRHWAAYGTWQTINESPYANFAVLFTALIYPLWTGDAHILEIAITVLPALLGFTLAGYAMFLAFSDRSFLAILARLPVKDKNGPPIYRAINSTFVHFILIQVAAFLWTLALDAYIGTKTPDAFQTLVATYIGFMKPYFLFWGTFLFIYALVLAFAVTMNMFRFTTWYEKVLLQPAKENKTENFGSGIDRH